MNPYLLLILLTSWSLLVTHAEICDTGVAFANSVLSVARSSLANADVALLKSYYAQSVETCMEECCAGTYGSCSVATFKKNATKNCIHFYCRPLKQCKFVSSSSADSFTFSAEPHASHPVPSSNLSTTKYTTTTAPTTITTTTAKSKFEQPHAVEEIATFSDEQVNLKNDNTSIKPRKGVTALTPDVILPKSGIKPRKGVTVEDVPHSKYLAKALNKSNVKPRKGVKTYPADENVTLSSADDEMASSSKQNSSDDAVANELASVLAKMFEDDPASSLESSTAIFPTSTVAYHIVPSTFNSIIYPSQSVEHHSSSHISSSSLESSTRYYVEPSFSSTPSLEYTTSLAATSSEVVKVTADTRTSSTFYHLASEVPLLSARAHLSLLEPKSVEKPLTVNSQDSENDRKYKSSIHLVLSLIFGLLVLFAVLGVVAKRMYDGWQRRDYYRMNYLIDGIYNGYE